MQVWDCNFKKKFNLTPILLSWSQWPQKEGVTQDGCPSKTNVELRHLKKRVLEFIQKISKIVQI